MHLKFKYLNNDFFQGLIIFIVSTIYLFEVIKLPSPFAAGYPSSSLFPWILVCSFYICSGVFFKNWIGNVFYLKKDSDRKEINFLFLIRPLLGIFCTIFFIFLFPRVRFWFSLIIYISVIFYIVEYYEKKETSKCKLIFYSILIGIVGTIILYFVFVIILNISMPGLL